MKVVDVEQEQWWEQTLSSKLDQTLSSSIILKVIRIWARLRIEGVYMQY